MPTTADGQPSDDPDGGHSPPYESRDDGFTFAAKLDALDEGAGTTVAVGGREYALFLSDGKVHAIDSACPHEGANLADGEFANGVVTCPWHSWTFDACSGCSLEPRENDVTSYETLIEDGRVYLKVEAGPAAEKPGFSQEAGLPTPTARKPVTADLRILNIIHETPDVRTFRLDNSTAKLPLDFPGKFAKVRVDVDGEAVWRSFTISSSPTNARTLDLTIKLNPDGVVSRWLFERTIGDEITLKGSQGGFYFDPETHAEPLVLVSAGSGVTPMMSIARFLEATNSPLPCTFLYGSRSRADIVFHEECLALAAKVDAFRYHVTLSQPDEGWVGACGRLDIDQLRSRVPDLAANRYFLCGPNAFMDDLRTALHEAGVPADRVHTEQFHASPNLVTS